MRIKSGDSGPGIPDTVPLPGIQYFERGPGSLGERGPGTSGLAGCMRLAHLMARSWTCARVPDTGSMLFFVSVRRAELASRDRAGADA